MRDEPGKDFVPRMVALLLLGTGIAAAEEAGIGNAEATEALDVPITAVYRGYGFALKE